MRQKPITWPTRNQSRSFNDNNNNNNNKNFSQETKKKIEHLQISKSYPLSKKNNKQNPKKTIKYLSIHLTNPPPPQKKKNPQNPKKRNVANASISPPSSKSQIRRALSRVRIICIIHRYVIARGNEWASKAGRVTDVCSSE